MFYLCKSLLFILLIICSSQTYASPFKIAGYFGLGSFTAQREGLSASEGPFSLGFGYEYDISSRVAIGFEHIRSLNLSPAGTSIAVTGFTGRWYYLGPTPNALTFDEPYNRYRVLQKGLFPFVGWSAGFTQASVLGQDNVTNVVALNITSAVKAGFDYPLYNQYCLRAEFNYGISLVGTGKTNYYTLGSGLIYFW